MQVKLVGVDLAKNVFQVLGVDEKGQPIITRRLARTKVAEFFANLSPCTVAMEACGSSFYWARLFKSQGHEVKIIPAQFVKPFLKASKNDQNDAEAICEAAQRPTMRFVPIKTVEQQDREAEHYYRRNLVAQRNQVVCVLRSFLLEHGIALPLTVRRLVPNIMAELENAENALTPRARELVQLYLSQYQELTVRLNTVTKKIEQEFKSCSVGQRLNEVPGIGPISGSAFAALSGQAKCFRNGRTFAAWLGLVPSQYSSGDKQKLGRINKRGNEYLRTLLIHGARAELSKAKLRPENKDPRVIWALELMKRKGTNKAVVALANKNARVIWHLLTKDDEHYRYA